MIQWLSSNGFMLLQSAGIIASLLFSAHALRNDSKERKVNSLFVLTAGNRDIWKSIIEKPELQRILEPYVPGAPKTIPTLEEQVFVRSLILHLATAFRAKKYGMHTEESGVGKDIYQLFSKPLPRCVWQSVRQYQDPDFVEYLETHLRLI